MKWWKRPWVLPILLTIVIVAGSNWYIKQLMQEDTVPKEVVKTRLETMYQGSVEQITEVGAGYEAEILRNGALYRATVDHKTGKVRALTLLKEAQPEVAVIPTEDEEEKASETPVVENKPARVESDPVPKPQDKQETIPTEKPTSPPATAQKPVEKPAPTQKKSIILTERQAANIALNRLNAKVPVEVDDIDFVETTQGGYYLVELELDTDADLDEVVYQIHAISGKVISESWD
ncbi:PepSY domain-containing protein [Sporosarcina obsidiansis]|uniref:PepSY domain-containing protein n=1 Tax=Sporosarcina obsidiansis TaxID=2660748 RepID=UPI001891F1F2|nr:PepSY domain-containing protein [Sporosarcina obsidiansis]